MHPNSESDIVYLGVLTETEMHNLYAHAVCIITVICVGDSNDTKTVFSG